MRKNLDYLLKWGFRNVFKYAKEVYTPLTSPESFY